MCTPPPPYLLFSNGWQNRLLFSLHSFLLKKSLHSGGLQLPSSSLGLERYLRLFPLNDPDTPTLLHRSIGSRSSPDISFVFSSLGRSCFGRYFRILVLTTYNSSICPSPRSFAPTSVPLPSTFRKLVGMALPLTLTHTVVPQRNTLLFLFLLLLLSLPFWH